MTETGFARSIEKARMSLSDAVECVMKLGEPVAAAVVSSAPVDVL